MFQRIFPFAFLFYFSETNAFLGGVLKPIIITATASTEAEAEA